MALPDHRETQRREEAERSSRPEHGVQIIVDQIVRRWQVVCGEIGEPGLDILRLEEETHDGYQTEQERKQREEGVVGYAGRHVGGIVVRHLSDGSDEEHDDKPASEPVPHGAGRDGDDVPQETERNRPAKAL